MDRRASETHALVFLAALAGLTTACRACPSPSEQPAREQDANCRQSHPVHLRAHLERNEQGYLEARRDARSWLDNLTVDPEQLRTHGIKGKKKLVEILDAYVWMLRAPLAGEEPSLEKRVREVVEVTSYPDYHDMASVDDRQFKQDATSYMRAAYLMDELGLDTTYYRQQMKKVMDRYDAHLPRRGPAQKMIFHVYYEHFGFEEPFALDQAFEKGIITSRSDPQTMKRIEMYHLTHEIFMPFRYGEVRETDFFDDADIEYLARALPVLVKRRISSRDPDLVAELVLCMEYLDLENDPAYTEGIDFLLSSQNPDGSWGYYPKAEEVYGEWAVYHVYLHTTKLALSALINAWRCPG